MGYAVGLLSVLHLWLMGNKWKYAPLYGCILQLLWAYYAWHTDKALLISTSAFFIVNFRNLLIWQKGKTVNEITFNVVDLMKIISENDTNEIGFRLMEEVGNKVDLVKTETFLYLIDPNMDEEDKESTIEDFENKTGVRLP